MAAHPIPCRGNRAGDRIVFVQLSCGPIGALRWAAPESRGELKARSRLCASTFRGVPRESTAGACQRLRGFHPERFIANCNTALSGRAVREGKDISVFALTKNMIDAHVQDDFSDRFNAALAARNPVHDVTSRLRRQLQRGCNEALVKPRGSTISLRKRAQ